MSTEKLSRRQFMRMGAMVAAGATLVACAPSALAPTGGQTGESPAGEADAPAKAQGNIVIMWLDNEVVEADRNLFMEKNPEIGLEFLTFDETRFMAMLAAGTPPDNVRAKAIETPYTASRNIWRDLGPYIDASSKIKWDDLHPVNEMNRYEGKLYGIVKDWSPDFSLWINQDQMQEAGLALPAMDKPIDLVWLRDASAKLTKREGDRTLQFGFDNGTWDGRFLEKAMIDAGTSMFSPAYDKVVLRDNPKALEYLGFVTDWALEKTMSSAINPAPDWGGPNFASGLSSIICQGYWYSGFLEQNKSEVNGQMYPAWSFAGGEMYNPCGEGTSGSIPRDSKNPDAAWVFQEFFMFEEPAIARAQSGWGVPSFKSQFELMPREGEFRSTLFNTVMQQAEVALPPLKISPYARMAAFDQPNAKYQEMYLRGEISFDEYVGKVEDEANATIQDEIERRS